MAIRAICVRCGQPKKTPFDRCRACGFQPESEYQMGRALIFSLTKTIDGLPLGRDEQALKALSTEIQAGRFYEFDPKEEQRAVQAYRRLRENDERRKVPTAMAVLVGLLVGAGLLWLASGLLYSTATLSEGTPITGPKTQNTGMANSEQRTRRSAAAAHEEREKREQALRAAFDAQYVQPNDCEGWTSRQHMVECANHKIRAEREFRAQRLRE